MLCRVAVVPYPCSDNTSGRAPVRGNSWVAASRWSPASMTRSTASGRIGHRPEPALADLGPLVAQDAVVDDVPAPTARHEVEAAQHALLRRADAAQARPRRRVQDVRL